MANGNIIGIVWGAYLEGRRTSAVGSKWHGVLLSASHYNWEQTGRKAPGLCGAWAVAASRWEESLGAGQGLEGQAGQDVHSTLQFLTLAFIPDYRKLAMVGRGRAHS